MTKTFESEALVRFPDCDPFNHLNNARYLDYFMNAREDHLRESLGFNLHETAREMGVGWVAAVSQIAYLRPAALMERIRIDSTILRWEEKTVLVEMRMWDSAKEVLKALLWATFAHVDVRTGRRIAHSEELTRRFAPLEAPLPDTSMRFEERVAEVRRTSGR